MSRSRTDRGCYTSTPALAERETSRVGGVFTSRKDALHTHGSEGSPAFHQSS
jgi:hypothetical protein